MGEQSNNFTTLIEEPDTLLGLDHLIEFACRVLERYMETCPHNSAENRLGQMA